MHQSGFDIIGDIHGRGSELVQLLEAMDYTVRDGCFRHPSRIAIFVGDFIDRGPEIHKTLSIVKSMVDHGAAQAVLGNHEFNAIAFHTADPANRSEFVRRHTESNILNIRETTSQLTPSQLVDALQWFRSLPFWLEFDEFRVVHACWNQDAINLLGEFNGNGLTDDFIVRAARPSGDLYNPANTVLKGKKMTLPEGISFYDSDAKVRTKARTRWFDRPEGQSYSSYSLSPEAIDCEHPLEPFVVEDASPYAPDERLVFIGHYRMQGSIPATLAKNVICVDWVLARASGIVAYRWAGESECKTSKFFWVN
jgi:hypothetical protein